MQKFTGDDFIQMALQIETNGKAYYDQCASAVEDDDTKLRQLFQYLSAAEVKHKWQIQELGESLKFDTSNYDEEDNLYLNALVDSRLFTTPLAAINQAGKAKSPADMLNFAINFEKDTVLFYFEMLANVQDEAYDAVKQLIREEQEHVRILSQKLTEL